MAVRRGSVVELTNEEAMTYLHLGIIASLVGTRDSIYKRKQTIKREGGLPANKLDLIAWFAEQFSEERLARLRDFRGQLVHGVCMVAPDGQLTIFDKQGKHEYGAEDVKRMAGSFWSLDFKTAVTMTSYTVEGGPTG